MADENSTDSDVAELDERIAEQEAQIDQLRQQVGGHGDGPQDPEDTAAALTNMEELQAILETLQQRRARLVGED
jgi:hypothetical protein